MEKLEKRIQIACWQGAAYGEVLKHIMYWLLRKSHSLVVEQLLRRSQIQSPHRAGNGGLPKTCCQSVPIALS